MRKHISKSGKIVECKAKNVCPLGTAVSGEKAAEKLQDFLNEKYTQEGKLEYSINNNIELTTLEAFERGKYIEQIVGMYVNNELTTEHIHKDKKTGNYTEERKKQHRQILDDIHEKYKDVPNNQKVLFSGGIPGAGKTTILNKIESMNPNFNVKDYAFVSCDDFKEELAERGMLPEVGGVAPMEISTLSHSEATLLSDTFMEECSSLGKNIIYDFTCKREDETMGRINKLLSHEYKEKDMQFVFVDIPINVAKDRTIYRYMTGMNKHIENPSHVGGRYMPDYVLNSYKSTTGKYSSVNAETLVILHEKMKDKGLPEPIVYDNSGSSPVELDFKKFAERYYSDKQLV